MSEKTTVDQLPSTEAEHPQSYRIATQPSPDEVLRQRIELRAREKIDPLTGDLKKSNEAVHRRLAELLSLRMQQELSVLVIQDYLRRRVTTATGEQVSDFQYRAFSLDIANSFIQNYEAAPEQYFSERLSDDVRTEMTLAIVTFMVAYLALWRNILNDFFIPGIQDLIPEFIAGFLVYMLHPFQPASKMAMEQGIEARIISEEAQRIYEVAKILVETRRKLGWTGDQDDRCLLHAELEVCGEMMQEIDQSTQENGSSALPLPPVANADLDQAILEACQDEEAEDAIRRKGKE